MVLLGIILLLLVAGRRPAGAASVSLMPVAKVPSVPGAITHAGNSRLVVTLLDGRIVIVEGGQVVPTPLLDISAQVALGDERGLLSAAFHPNYAVNGFFVRPAARTARCGAGGGCGDEGDGSRVGFEGARLLRCTPVRG